MIKNEPTTPYSQAFQQMLTQIYGPQQVTPFTGDWSTYGQSAGEHQFFRPGPAPGGSPFPSPGGTPPSPGGAGPANFPNYPAPVPGAPIPGGIEGYGRGGPSGGLGVAAGLTSKDIILALREASQGTGQKLTKSDRQQIRTSASTREGILNFLNSLDRGAAWVQNPLGEGLGALGVENSIPFSNPGISGLLATGVRAGLTPVRQGLLEGIVPEIGPRAAPGISATRTGTPMTPAQLAAMPTGRPLPARETRNDRTTQQQERTRERVQREQSRVAGVRDRTPY